MAWLGDMLSASSTVLRCNSCTRPVAARWRRCPFCKSPTGNAYDPAHPFLDRSLNTFRALGIGASIWIFVAAMLLHFQFKPLAAIALASSGAFFLLAHLFAPWLAGAWIAAELGWVSITIGLAIAFWPWRWAAAVGLVMPLAALAWMARSHRHQLARLTGAPISEFRANTQVPKWTPCAWCGNKDAEVIAPLYCMSLVSFTVRMPGTFRSLCASHARIRAIPATLFSLVMGWWGIPWGPIWTAQVVAHNLGEGGATLDSAVLRDMREREKALGGPDEPSVLIDGCVGLVLAAVPFFALIGAGYFRQ